jgi:hypothetical protein
VTVPGGNGVTIAIPFTSGENSAAATALLQTLYYADGNLTHIADASSGSVPAVAGDVNEFVDNLAGQIAVPDGYQYLTDAFTIGSGPTITPLNSFIGYGLFDGAIIDAGASSLSFQAGTGNESIVAGGNITITTRVTGGGSGELLLDGTGTENATLTTGVWSVSTGNGQGTITLGAGQDTVQANGSDTVTGGTGRDVVNFNTNQDLYNGGAGGAFVTDYGTNDSINGGAGAVVAFAQSSGLHVQGGGGEVTLVEAGGDNTLTANRSGVVVFAGPLGGSTYNTGTSYFFYTSAGGSDTINAAAGTQGPIVFGSANGRITLNANAAAPGSFVVGGAGNETIDGAGSGAGITFFAGTGNTDMIGGSGSNFYAASSGNSTMSGGTGNVYEIINGHAGGTEVITDFTPYDGLYLSGYGTGQNDGIRSEIENKGTLDMVLSDGTQIQFDNISNPNQLDGLIHNI